MSIDIILNLSDYKSLNNMYYINGILIDVFVYNKVYISF